MTEHRVPPAAVEDRLAVYYDGSCPLCTAEICYYRKRAGSDRIEWIDVAAAGDSALAADGLTREAALARFHVRTPDGRLESGAKAFAALWRGLPSFKLLGQIAAAPVISQVLELAYRAFLPLRPWLQRRFRARATPR